MGPPAKRVSMDSVAETLRRGGVPFMHHVQVIISPPKTDREKENAARFQQSGGRHKWPRRDREEEDDEEGGGHAPYAKAGAATAGAAADPPAATKMYLKAPTDQRGCPRDAPSYGKGDVWVLWRPEGPVETAEGLGRERADLLASLPATRAAYLDAKFQKGAGHVCVVRLGFSVLVWGGARSAATMVA